MNTTMNMTTEEPIILPSSAEPLRQEKSAQLNTSTGSGNDTINQWEQYVLFKRVNPPTKDLFDRQFDKINKKILFCFPFYSWKKCFVPK